MIGQPTSWRAVPPCIVRTVEPVSVSAHIIHIEDRNISTLHQYVVSSHETPLCVVSKTDSQLAKKVVKLWLASVQATECPLASWVLTAVNTTVPKRLPRYLLKDSHPPRLPGVRCFLGSMWSHDFDDDAPPTRKRLQRWFCQMMAQYNQLVNSDVEMIEASVGVHRFTLVIFPTVHQHEQLENAAFQVREALSKECEVNAIVIHPSSANLKNIVDKYRVFNVPSVLVIDQDAGTERRQTLFNIHDVMTGRMETDLRARLIPARKFTFSDFGQEVVRVRPGEHYSPVLIGFYAHWEHSTPVFLSFLLHTVLEFRSLGVDVRFGLVDAASDPSVVSHFMSPTCLQHLPFLAVFHAEEGRMTADQTELLLTHPSPFTVYSTLQEAGLVLTDSHQQPISYQPYGHNTQMCLWSEGPRGDRCSYNNSACCMAEVTDSLHSLPTQGMVVGKEDDEKSSKLPVATTADGLSIGASSDGEESDVSVSIDIFIFVRYPCKSCEENQPHFQSIYEQLSANDSYRVRMVNCSQTAVYCERHHVTGFPTVLAFRWHRSPARCCNDHSGTRPGDWSVRQDYHGVLTVAALMNWINSVSVSPVQSLHFATPHWTQKESTQLIATIVPLDSKFLPLPPHKDQNYFYTTQCYREVCERLFGLVACFTVNSADVPPSQFDGQHEDYAVTQVEFRRRDGIKVSVMQLGRSLADLLDEETNQVLHMFHTHHSYSLPRKQTCEDDHGHCTLFLESFARDHLRLPVTALTSDILHSHNDFLFGKEAPVLLALVEEDSSAEFKEVLQNTAYTFYKEVVVATLDASTYPAWAGSFVPRSYHQVHAESSGWGELGLYPRLCMFYWQDHSKAAFYPPVKATASGVTGRQLDDVSGTSSQLLTEDLVAGFVRQFLQDPASQLIETEQF